METMNDKVDETDIKLLQYLKTLGPDYADKLIVFTSRWAT